MSTEENSILQEILEEVHTIKRGLYGDEKNKTKGLIQKQEEDHARFEKNEARISSLEESRTKLKWIWVAITTSVSLAFAVFGDHIKSLFK